MLMINGKSAISPYPARADSYQKESEKAGKVLAKVGQFGRQPRPAYRAKGGLQPAILIKKGSWPFIDRREQL
ncbi:MAG: hypothetical protein V4711_03820 [Pseudomonadota bacterium]